MKLDIEAPLAKLGKFIKATQELSDYCVDSPVEIKALLKQVLDSKTLVSLSGPNGVSYTTTIWSLDEQRNTIMLNVDKDAVQLNSLIKANEATAVAYLDAVKLQFDLRAFIIVHGESRSTLQCEWPSRLYRIQRRSSFRVRPLVNHSPTANFLSPTTEKMCSLRILDVSLGGVALLCKEDQIPVAPGAIVEKVELALDSDTQIQLDLRLHHITDVGANDQTVRLGCEFLNLSPVDARDLQRFVDQTQKRRRLLAKNS